MWDSIKKLYQEWREMDFGEKFVYVCAIFWVFGTFFILTQIATNIVFTGRS